MAQHTKGPWNIRELPGGSQIHGSIGPPLGGPPVFAECFGPNHEANARLIAAAPDLLEACQIALNDLSGPGPPGFGFDAELIRKAINKATEGTC